MSGGTNDEALREQLALAAVGALGDDERADLDAALAGRPDLVAELAELEAAAAVLAEATAETPPPGLRAQVLDAIATTPQQPAGGPTRPDVPARIPAATDVPSPGARVAVPPPALEPRAGTVVSLDRARRRRGWIAAVAAAAVIVLGAGVVLSTVVGDDDSVQVADVVEDEQAVVVPLVGTVPSLRVVHSGEDGALALVGEDVSAPEGDSVYELWMIEDEVPEPLGIFRPAEDGSVEVLVTDLEVPAGAIFAVTVEPAGGGEVPTGELVASSA